MLKFRYKSYYWKHVNISQKYTKSVFFFFLPIRSFVRLSSIYVSALNQVIYLIYSFATAKSKNYLDLLFFNLHEIHTDYFLIQLENFKFLWVFLNIFQTNFSLWFMKRICMTTNSNKTRQSVHSPFKLIVHELFEMFDICLHL